MHQRKQRQKIVKYGICNGLQYFEINDETIIKVFYLYPTELIQLCLL